MNGKTICLATLLPLTGQPSTQNRLAFASFVDSGMSAQEDIAAGLGVMVRTDMSVYGI